MFETLFSTLHLLLGVAGWSAAAESGGVAVLVALAVTVLLAAALRVAVPAAPARSGPHPRRAIDRSSPLTQSDPDASGHPRPRAPGAAAAAA